MITALSSKQFRYESSTDEVLYQYCGKPYFKTDICCAVCKHAISSSYFFRSIYDLNALTILDTAVIPHHGKYFIVPTDHPECRELFKLNPLAYETIDDFV